MNKVLIATALLVLVAVSASARITVASRQVATKAPQLNLCPTCVSFAGQAIDQLLNIIVNVGVIGGCNDLCSKLPNKIEDTVCNLLCDYVGIKEFINIVEKADLDPIYYCELLDVCPKDEGGNATITHFSVSPTSGPQGTKFVFTMQFEVFNKTGTGEIVIDVNPPDAEPFGDGELNEGFAPGAYSVNFELQAQPSEQEPFDAGNYETVVALCAGSCGSGHPWSKVFGEAKTTFTITQ